MLHIVLAKWWKIKHIIMIITCIFEALTLSAIELPALLKNVVYTWCSACYALTNITYTLYIESRISIAFLEHFALLRYRNWPTDIVILRLFILDLVHEMHYKFFIIYNSLNYCHFLIILNFLKVVINWPTW